MHGTLNPVFRLKSWTVRKYKERFYISCLEHPKDWGKPYKTLRHACTTISRKLEAEWTERARRSAL